MKITRQVQPWDKTDKIVKVYITLIFRSFQKIRRKLSVANFDEVNVIGTVNTEWQKIDAYMKEALLKIVVYYYRVGFQTCGKPPPDDMEAQMVFAKLLDSLDPVTHYLFLPESDRKRARLIEALLSVRTVRERNKQLDIGIRYIVRQLRQTADDYTMDVLIQSFKDAGVEEVEWVTQQDEKVCAECEPLDGQIFKIDKVPMLPAHYGCRCYIIPVLRRNK